jgi:hypothetical protein
MTGAIIRQRTGNFDPSTFRNRYEESLQQLIEAKMKGVGIRPTELSAPPPVIDFDGSVETQPCAGSPTPKRRTANKAKRIKEVPDRRQPALLLPVSGLLPRLGGFFSGCGNAKNQPIQANGNRSGVRQGQFAYSQTSLSPLGGDQ